MEYLITYSWAILVIAVVIAALFALKVFNPGGVVGTQCILPAGLECTTAFLSSNGLLSIGLLQVTQSPINITTYGCNANDTVVNMQAPLHPPSNQIRMQIGANYTFNVWCWAGNSHYSTNPGTYFQGYIFVNYTESTTGFPHTASGKLALTVT